MTEVRRRFYCCCIVGLFCASSMAQDAEFYFSADGDEPGVGGDLTITVAPGGGTVCVDLYARSLTGADIESLGTEVTFNETATFDYQGSPSGTLDADCASSAIVLDHTFQCDPDLWSTKLVNAGPDDCTNGPVHFVHAAGGPPPNTCDVPDGSGLYIAELCYDYSADACGTAVIADKGVVSLGDADGNQLPNGAVFRTLTINVAPANDDCADATTIADGPDPIGTQFDAACATLDGDAGPSCGTGAKEQDIWFWTAPQNLAGEWTISFDGPSDHNIQIYSKVACPPGPGDELACILPGGAPAVVKVQAGETLLIRIGGAKGPDKTGNVTTDFHFQGFCPMGPPEGVGACLPKELCCPCYLAGSESQCTDLGGEYCGDGSRCPKQRVRCNLEEALLASHGIGPPRPSCPNGGGGGVSRTEECKPGVFIDPWESPPNAQTCQEFGVPGSPAIPPDFFGPVSDPFTGSVCFEGVPLGATQFGEFGDADTLIQRASDPFDRCDPPSATQVTVAIEIVELSLVSIDPITVTFNGGQDPEQWDVAVDLSSVTPPAGTLTAIKTHCNGGTYTSTLNVQPKFTFTRVADPGAKCTDPGKACLDTGKVGIDPVNFVQNDPAPWVSDVEPSFGVPVDPCSGFPCSDFHAGIEESNPTVNCECCIEDDCPSADVCNCGVCFGGVCAISPRPYGDLDCDGDIDLFDLFCILDGFSNVFCECSSSDDDLEPCEGDWDIDIFDLFAVINAFSGENPCNCPAGP